MNSRPLMCSCAPLKQRIAPHIVEGSHPTISLKKLCCASQHFGPSDFRNGSKPEITAVQHWGPLRPSQQTYQHDVDQSPPHHVGLA
jgi:hypothetical protein